MTVFKRRRGKWSGFSVPVLGGGFSWTPGTDEREVVRRLVIDLEARRALYGDLDVEGEWYVADSIGSIRDQLSEALKSLVDGSEATLLLSQLREECNTYLSTVPDPRQGSGNLRPHAAVALQSLRESFRVKLAYLGKGGFERAAELARRIPYEISALALAEPPPAYPVRFRCGVEETFRPSSGPTDVFNFEVFNESAKPVRIRSFGLDFTLFTSYERHEYEPAMLEQALHFPVRLLPNDAVEGWLSAEELPDRLVGAQEQIIGYRAYVDTAGYGTRAIEVLPA